jgi:hypothetical protein
MMFSRQNAKNNKKKGLSLCALAALRDNKKRIKIKTNNPRAKTLRRKDKKISLKHSA